MSTSVHNLLALSAVEGRLQFAFGDAQQCLFHEESSVPTQGAERLVPALAQAFSAHSIPLSQCAGIACVHGPGSFTGIRLCLATAAALRRVLRIPLAGLSTLDILAWQAISPNLSPSTTDALVCTEERPLLWVLTHARRNLVHAQPFILEPSGAVRAQGVVRVFSPLFFIELLAQEAAGTRVAGMLGSGVTRNAALFAPVCTQFGIRLLPEVCDVLSPQALLQAAAVAQYDFCDLQPVYVRVSDAEENIAHIAAGLGLDPRKAEHILHTLTRE